MTWSFIVNERRGEAWKWWYVHVCTSFSVSLFLAFIFSSQSISSRLLALISLFLSLLYILAIKLTGFWKRIPLDLIKRMERFFQARLGRLLGSFGESQQILPVLALRMEAWKKNERKKKRVRESGRRETGYYKGSQGAIWCWHVQQTVLPVWERTFPAVMEKSSRKLMKSEHWVFFNTYGNDVDLDRQLTFSWRDSNVLTVMGMSDDTHTSICTCS